MSYERQIATAQRLISKFGGPATLVVTAPSTPDPSKPWETPNDTEQSESVVAVFLRYQQKYIDNDVIHAGDQRVIVAADGLVFAPNLQGRVERVVGGVTEAWKVVSSNPLNVNGQEPILYELQVRQ